jgi:hypothetical protein
MPLSLDTARHIADRLTRPERFFTGPDFLLDWSHVEREEVWEVFQGRLLDRAHTRRRRPLESWNVHVRTGGDPDVPLLSLLLDAGEGKLHVVRGVESYVWEGYAEGGNVYQSRERRKWTRELIAGFDLAEHDAGELCAEVACALSRAVTGARLPLTPIEAPLPAFSFGELFYAEEAGEAGANTGEPGVLTPGGARQLRGLTPPARQSLPSREIEAWLRAVPVDELPMAAREMAARWSSLGRTGNDLLGTFRRLFNEVSLSPWTDFAGKFVRLLALLQEMGTLGAEQVLDFEGYLLRQLGRHLTAYDLVTFHHRGANYPDALLLDLVLNDYLARLEQAPGLFEGEAGRLRRRALRQGWLLRRRYEGHAVPDVPTSPGEHARVFPEGYPRVPEEQLLQVGRRRRRLYEGDPLPGRLSPVVRALLGQSLEDLAHPDERQELAAAVFFDRPFGGGKAAVEPDATLLLGSLACSRSIAAQRLRCLAGDLGVSVPQPEALDLPGLPLDAIGAAMRQGPGLSLTDAAWASADFVYRFTLPGSVAALRRMLALAGVEGPLDLIGPGQVLLARSRESAGLVVHDESWQPRLELEPRLEQGYASRRGLEYPRGGFRARRIGAS